MTKLEHYTAKAADSLAAAEAAISASERAFHRRAHSIWRRLMADTGKADEEAARGVRAKAIRR